MVRNMAQSEIAVAFGAEAAALSSVASGLTNEDLGRASPCPPWTVGELLCHVLTAAGRIEQALSEPDGRRAVLASAGLASAGPANTGLISTVDYYRPDERFSATTNADRIETARVLARQLGGADAISAELGSRCREAVGLLQAAPAERIIGPGALVVGQRPAGLPQRLGEHRTPAGDVIQGDCDGVLAPRFRPRGGTRPFRPRRD
jgi:Mycothiol maleylpyruvate isomerase N-terminal domain